MAEDGGDFFEFEDVEIKRYFGSRADGTDLFYISLRDYGLDTFYLESSLPMEFFFGEDLERLVKVITNKKTSMAVRDHFVKLLIRRLIAMPDAATYFFRSEYLDKYGRYCEPAYRVWNDLLSSTGLKMLEPYSEYHNQNVFEIVQKSFSKNEEPLMEMSKEEFEDKVKLKFDLQLAYVEVYSFKEVNYWIDEADCDDEKAYVYLMTVSDRLVFFFLFRL